MIAKAAELDASRIKIGMETEIRVNAFKHDTLKGIVRDIDLAAQEADGWKEQQATFGVKVEVVNPPKELRSGQSAIIDIVTDKFADVLYLEHEFIIARAISPSSSIAKANAEISRPDASLISRWKSPRA